MEPHEPDVAVSRKEFDQLSGYVIGLTNAVRALIEAAPDRIAALAAVEKCFATESALGQSFEHLDHNRRSGLEHCLEELKLPIRHEWVIDSDPDGLIAKAEQHYADRQQRLTNEVLGKLLRPDQAGDAESK